MEIKRLNDNQIRCALTEEEIEDMGFSIDDIIGNTETTQKFMHVVLNMVEEQEQIDMDRLSPMVRAELLQDHSMAITFGGESDNNFKNLLDLVNQLMSQMKPEKLEELRYMSREERESSIEEFLSELEEKLREQAREAAETGGKTEVSDADADDGIFQVSAPLVLEFGGLDDVIRMSRLFREAERLPQSSLYKQNRRYYLLLDFITFSKAELGPFAFAAIEYDSAHFSDPARAAFVIEHGKCIMKNEALQMLMQL